MLKVFFLMAVVGAAYGEVITVTNGEAATGSRWGPLESCPPGSHGTYKYSICISLKNQFLFLQSHRLHNATGFGRLARPR